MIVELQKARVQEQTLNTLFALWLLPSFNVNGSETDT